MATYTPTNDATLQSAVSGAVAGDTINTAANNITAGTLSTLLTVAAGVTLTGTGTLSGYQWLFEGSTSVTTTISGTVASKLKLDIDGVDPHHSFGPILCRNGRFSLTDVQITGASSSTSSNAGNSLTFNADSAVVTATMLRCSVSGAAADCVSAKTALESAGANGPASRLDCIDCEFSDPGDGSADNAFTTHGTFPARMYGGRLHTPGATGPLFNYADNSPFELYGVDIDATGSTVTTQACTTMVGCNYTGPRVLIQGFTGYIGLCAYNVIRSAAADADALRHTTGDAIFYANDIQPVSTPSGQSFGIELTAPASVVRNYVAGYTPTNSGAIRVILSSPGGTVDILNNTMVSVYSGIQISSSTNTATVVTAYNNVADTVQQHSITKGSNGTITGDYNTFESTVSGYTAGSNDLTSTVPALSPLDDAVYGSNTVSADRSRFAAHRCSGIEYYRLVKQWQAVSRGWRHAWDESIRNYLKPLGAFLNP